MNSKSALLIVERNFFQTHVGVKRVIHHYWHLLLQEGYSVTLASPINGKLSSCCQTVAYDLMKKESISSINLKPTWRSTYPTSEIVITETDPPLLKYSDDIWNSSDNISPEEYTISIITTPWMCTGIDNLPEAKYSIGIVYDMVPNLLAIGALRMPRFVNAYEFAYRHSLGYDFYLKHVEKIVCISESTKNDFISFYQDRIASPLTVSIPFEDFGNGIVSNTPSNTVLLINVLDHRKNFTAVASAIKSASSKIPLKLIIVGKERMSLKDVTDFFDEISSTCETVEWFRSPNDIQLEQLMSKSNILFFPSFYEGLGLPILEAQAKGLPVISSNNSSCKEINLNPELTAEPSDHSKFAVLLKEVLTGSRTVLKGEELRSAQITFLNTVNSLNVF
ncbi:glycosyltransferase [Pseudomonas sp. Irchel s3b5]|uniref:glycosyltransferase n=1 Tax=Pseudomonas sp. Irchel s3b5 TaxID=2009077 RepID=UPI000BA33AD2|nr:glycosyltransferase [Pseudomonas sp. Irchel s3b5]